MALFMLSPLMSLILLLASFSPSFLPPISTPQGEYIVRWSSPVNISNTPDWSGSPALTVDPSGSLHVVWMEENWGIEEWLGEILYASKPADGSWSSPVNISNTSDWSSQPDIAVDPSGSLHVVWTEENWGIEEWWGEILYASKPADGSWSSPVNISNTSDWSGYPALTVDPSGSPHIAWTEDGEIFYTRQTSGGAWATPTNISATSEWSDYPSIAVDPSSSPHVVWMEYGGIFYASKPADGSWSSPVNIFNTTSDWSGSPALTVDPSGSLHVVWMEENWGIEGYWAEIYYASKPADGSWSSPVNISNTSGWSGDPALTVDPSGSLHVVWMEYRGIFYASKPADGSWSSPANISNTQGWSDLASIAVDPSGSPHVVWADDGILYTTLPQVPLPDFKANVLVPWSSQPPEDWPVGWSWPPQIPAQFTLSAEPPEGWPEGWLWPPQLPSQIVLPSEPPEGWPPGWLWPPQLPSQITWPGEPPQGWPVGWSWPPQIPTQFTWSSQPPEGWPVEWSWPPQIPAQFTWPTEPPEGWPTEWTWPPQTPTQFTWSSQPPEGWPVEWDWPPHIPSQIALPAEPPQGWPEGWSWPPQLPTEFPWSNQPPEGWPAVFPWPPLTPSVVALPTEPPQGWPEGWLWPPQLPTEFTWPSEPLQGWPAEWSWPPQIPLQVTLPPEPPENWPTEWSWPPQIPTQLTWPSQSPEGWPTEWSWPPQLPTEFTWPSQPPEGWPAEWSWPPRLPTQITLPTEPPEGWTEGWLWPPQLPSQINLPAEPPEGWPEGWLWPPQLPTEFTWPSQPPEDWPVGWSWPPQLPEGFMWPAQTFTGIAPPVTVQFTDQSAGYITSWVWDFGDGSTSTEENPSHTYADYGNYTVSLIASGPGGTVTKTKTAYISVYQAPEAQFSANTIAILEGQAVHFTQQSRGGVTTWLWDFGDGSTGIEQNPSHIYASPGNYTVSLTISNPITDDTETRTSYIAVYATPQAQFTANLTQIGEGQTVQFTDQSTGSITTWLWDFGDGSTGTGQSPSHIYASPGNYTVSLTISNPITGDTEARTSYIAVYATPQAQFTANLTQIGEGQTVQFTDQSTGSITSWLWDFGDGSTGTEQNPSHTYASAGNYTVSLTVSNPITGDTETRTSYISVAAPQKGILSCACRGAAKAASASSIATGWALFGLSWGTSCYLLKRYKKRPK